jgi:D-amino peptidase
MAKEAIVKVWISVDMEGIGGVAHDRPATRGDAAYPASVALMVGETNAAIEGAYLGGATEVVVNDSHGGMFNLPAADVDPRASLISGRKPWSMLTGAGPDAGVDVALFVGYHVRAGHPTGTIAHTYSYAPTLTLLDGRPVGESGINASVLGAWGVPVGMVSGDDMLAEETAAWLPWAERVVVKGAVSRLAAAFVHPTVARERVRDGARRAVERAAEGDLPLLAVPEPVHLEVEYVDAGLADRVAIVPLSERYGDRGVRIVAPNAVEAFRAFLAGIRLAEPD